MKSSRIAVIALTMVLECPFSARAQAPTQDLLEALGRCAAIADDHARLACYDAMSPRLKDALAAPPAMLPGNRAPTAEEERSWFGFDLGNLFGASPPSRRRRSNSAATGCRDEGERGHGRGRRRQRHRRRQRICLQPVRQVHRVPRQRTGVEADRGDVDRAVFPKPGKDNKVTISRGFIGSYNLTINDSAKVFKVTRVK